MNELDKYIAMTTAQLKSLYASSQKDVSSKLRTMAFAVVALRRRGEAESGMDDGVMAFAEEIVTGALDPAMVLKLAKRPKALNSISGTPVEFQRRLVKGEAVVVASDSGDNKIVPEERPIYRLTDREVGMAFSGGKTVPFLAQKSRLESDRRTVVAAARQKHVHRTTSPKVRLDFDPRREEFIVGSARIPYTAFSSLAVAAGFLPLQRKVAAVA